jgi:hypothetical protein
MRVHCPLRHLFSAFPNFHPWCPTNSPEATEPKTHTGLNNLPGDTGLPFRAVSLKDSAHDLPRRTLLLLAITNWSCAFQERTTKICAFLALQLNKWHQLGLMEVWMLLWSENSCPYLFQAVRASNVAFNFNCVLHFIPEKTDYFNSNSMNNLENLLFFTSKKESKANLYPDLSQINQP